jgi:hypothetical protein
MLSFIALALRIAVLGLFWFFMLVVGDYALTGIRVTAGPQSGGGLTALVVGILLIAGLAFTERMMRLRVSFDDQQMRVGFDKRQSAAGKTTIEPEALRLRDMIALLDEDDLDDLRAEVRETLRERIHRLSADESETFEELLSDSKRKRR